jgi:hypothetical protein
LLAHLGARAYQFDVYPSLQRKGEVLLLQVRDFLRARTGVVHQPEERDERRTLLADRPNCVEQRSGLRRIDHCAAVCLAKFDLALLVFTSFIGFAVRSFFSTAKSSALRSAARGAGQAVGLAGLKPNSSGPWRLDRGHLLPSPT